MSTTKETFQKDVISQPDVHKAITKLKTPLPKITEEAQVIIHCTLDIKPYSRIRIWESTYLFDNDSAKRIKMVMAYGISIFPNAWMDVGERTNVKFTLIFGGLPRACRQFDLHEITTSDPGEFNAFCIVRNETDVYHIRLIAGKSNRFRA